MRATPAAPYLTEFGSGSGKSALAIVGGRDRSEATDAAARMAEANESAKAAAMAMLEAKLAEERALSAQRLAAEREAWVTEQGARLAGQLAAGLQALEAQIADTAAKVLAPFLEARLCRQAIAELRTDLQVLLAKDANICLSVTGPEDLLQILRKELSGSPCSVTYVADETCDVRITADQTLLETRLGAWKARIEEAAR
jgi:hypothetical protein